MRALAVLLLTLSGCSAHSTRPDGDADLDRESETDADAELDGDMDADGAPDADSDAELDTEDADEPDACLSDCEGRECGPDGCEGSCGRCPDGQVCDDSGRCVGCLPDCEGRECGPDGCEGSCGPGCAAEQACNEAFGECISPGDFVHIPAGTFLMGSPDSEVGRQEDEPLRLVTLTHDFLLLSVKLTQELWSSLTDYTTFSCQDHPDLEICDPDRPVADATWWEAAAIANLLSEAEGLAPCYTCELPWGGTGWPPDHCLVAPEYATPYECEGYRLPTEAEWEYAARAGSTTATYNGDLDVDPYSCDPSEVLDPIAWWCGDFPPTSLGLPAVASRRPNRWGLWDLLGVDSEWTQDNFDESPSAEAAVDPVTPEPTDEDWTNQWRATRSGFGPAFGVRSAFRWGEYVQDVKLSFRLARTL